MTLLVCGMLTLAALFYIFFIPSTLRVGPEQTRAAFLRERKEAVYENLRDLNFEYKAGKYPEEDYVTQRSLLENEAAEIMGEMERLERA